MNEREYYKRNQLSVLKNERVNATEGNLVTQLLTFWQLKNQKILRLFQIWLWCGVRIINMMDWNL